MIRSLFSELAVLSAVCTAVLLICPGAEIKKYVRFAYALCALSVIISFLPFVKEMNFTEQTESISVTDMTDKAADLIAKETVSRLENAVFDLASQRHGIEKGDMSVKINYDGGENRTVSLESVKIELNGLKYAVYTVSLKNEVRELLGIPCEVVIAD